jgi:psiF repeat
MRPVITTVIVCLGFALASWRPAAAQSAAPAPVTAEAVGNPSDAAEKHVKRTGCLKDAKSKKLVGAQKTAFLKDCLSTDAQKPVTSASSVSP